MSRAAYFRKIKKVWASKGVCVSCGGRKARSGLKTCEVCAAAQARTCVRRLADGRYARAQRTPHGWASCRAAVHRLRVRRHNLLYPERPLLEKIIDGPSLLAHITVHGPQCGLCGIHTGYPWEHVGLESGPEVDHTLSMWAIINEGRDDWASISNVRLLCVSCHSTEGVRLKRQDIEERSHMEHMLSKDKA